MKYYTEQLSDKGTVAVDDTILVKGVQAAAGSRIMEGFKPLFSAEAVTRLENKGYEISGKTHVGEFGLDLVGEFSYYAEKEDSLKGAAAQLVAQGAVKAALGVDMNGATRRAAALSGVDFLKPTYGTVSRYGIISCAASGEQMGVYAGNVEGVKEIMEVIAGHDEKDGTCLKNDSYDYATDASVAGKKVCIIKELMEKADEDVRKNVYAYADKLRANGVTVEEISCDIFDVANTTWQILMTAETCNNVSRYDGVKFGYRAKEYKNIDELYVNTRTEGFNFLTKSVILYGSDALSKNRYNDCYGKALKVRRVVADRFEELMASYDAVLTPVCSKRAYSAYDIKDAFVKVFGESVFTAVANLIGTPALVSGGVQLMGKHFGESTLLSLAGCAERVGE
jgi:aspartyl-tRNA(Asn)/glutamyl-tRNA(Gln) amidotransferase subunit A